MATMWRKTKPLQLIPNKATLELPAEVSGTITLKAEEGDAVEVGQVVCLIDTDGQPAEGAAPAAEAPAEAAPKQEEKWLHLLQRPLCYGNHFPCC